MTADDLPEPEIQDLADIVAVPVDRSARRAPHGLFDGSGAFHPLSRTRLSHGRFSEVPEPAAPVRHLSGHHFYLGLGRNHFGHFLVESLARLWALDRIGHPIDSLVVLPMPGRHVQRRFTGMYQPILDALTGGLPLTFVTEPTRIERLSVASQGFGHQSWLAGTDAFRAFTRDRLTRAFPPSGPEKLYISRTAFQDDKRRVDREAEIETALLRAGYEIFQPEKHSLAEQCRRYGAARMISGADGSPFHLLPFVMAPSARTAIYLRRNRPEMLDRLKLQMRSFARTVPLLIDPRLDLSPPPQGTATPTPIDPGRVLDALEKTGFL